MNENHGKSEFLAKKRGRVILYTGKGGVGKTTIAAATAIQSAKLGYITIILSTDPSHSLSDSFDLPLYGKPKEIVENLYGKEIDFLREGDEQWEIIERWLGKWEAWAGKKWGARILVGMSLLSEMGELVSLLNILKYYQNSDYGLIIVDCAPTGQTLRLLGYPERLRWYLEKIFPIQRKAALLARPFIKGLFKIPMPEDEVFGSIKSFLINLDRMRKILTDANKTSFRLVVNPERMVINETQRLFTYLNLYGYHIDLIICNRLIPYLVKDHFFDFWKESQENYYKLIAECFSPLPIFTAPPHGKRGSR